MSKTISYKSKVFDHGQSIKVWITAQSHRQSEFGQGGREYFDFMVEDKRVRLLSRGAPQNNVSAHPKHLEFFLRGGNELADDDHMIMTTEQFAYFVQAVNEYNLFFADGAVTCPLANVKVDFRNEQQVDAKTTWILVDKSSDKHITSIATNDIEELKKKMQSLSTERNTGIKAFPLKKVSEIVVCSTKTVLEFVFEQNGKNV